MINITFNWPKNENYWAVCFSPPTEDEMLWSEYGNMLNVDGQWNTLLTENSGWWWRPFSISRPIVDWVIKKWLFIFVLSDVILSRHRYSTKTYPNIFTRLLFKIQSQLCDWCLVTLGPNKCKNNFTTSYKTSFVKNYSASQFTPLIHFQNIQALVSVVSLNCEYRIHTEYLLLVL